MIPYAKNQISLRIENLADRFDQQSQNSTQYFNLQEFVKKLYKDVNNGQDPLDFEIEETSLSGNMNIAEVRKRNTNIWKSKDDGKQLQFNERPKDKEQFEGVAVEP